MAKENALGLSQEDLSNISQVMNDLIDVVAKFNGPDDHTEADYSELKAVLDFAVFVVDGVIYSNGMDLCATHDHDEDDDD